MNQPISAVRKTAEYEETFEIELSKEEVDQRKDEVMDTLDDIKALDGEARDFSKQIAAKKEILKNRLDSLQREARSKRAVIKGVIEEFLMKDNQIRKFWNGQEIGVPRTAKPEELQESLLTKEQMSPPPRVGGPALAPVPDEPPPEASLDQEDDPLLPDPAPFEPEWGRG